MRILLPALLIYDLISQGSLVFIFSAKKNWVDFVGKNLQSTFVSLVKSAQKQVKRIWPEYIEAKHLPGPLSELVTI